MWAQLIRAPLKPGAEVAGLADVLKAGELPDSGLVREMFLHDQDNPDSVYVLALFESEEKARAREADPRRAEGLQAVRAWMAESLAGAPTFTNLIVDEDWTP